MSYLYMNDEEFRTNLRMVSLLSFVPIADTIQAFDVLISHLGNQEQVISNYFEISYIGELRRWRHFAPRFPHVMWNMSLRVLKWFSVNKRPWTMTWQICWFIPTAACSYLEIYSATAEYLTLNHHSTARIMAGAEVPPRVYHAINECIQLLVNNYSSNNIIDFLRRTSYNLA